MAFYSNWILSLVWIYFLCALFLTHKLYQEVEDGTPTKHPTESVASNSESAVNPGSPIKSGGLSPKPEYDYVGPPTLKELGCQTLFIFTKSLLELTVAMSITTSILYWLLLFDGDFSDNAAAMYYVNIHGIIPIFQLLDCYGSTYQLRYIYGNISIIFLSCIGLVWMWLFEALKLTNPFTGNNLLYSFMDLHNDTITSLSIYGIMVIITLVIYWFIVFTKNLALIKWRGRNSDNRQLSHDDQEYSDSL